MCVWQCVYAAGGQYNGEWRGDQRSGHGVLEAPDGSVYTGNFDGGVRAGSGELTHRTPVRVGGSDAHPLMLQTYKGEFEDDVPHGHGDAVFACGTKYKGQWDHGTMSGKVGAKGARGCMVCVLRAPAAAVVTRVFRWACPGHVHVAVGCHLHRSRGCRVRDWPGEEVLPQRGRVHR